MKKLIVFVCILGLCMSGCIKSLHSIVGEGDRILDERIEGVWTTEDANLGIVSDLKISFDTDDPTENIDSLKNNIEESMISLFGNKRGFWEISRAADLEFEMTHKKLNENSRLKSTIKLESVPENFSFKSSTSTDSPKYTLTNKVLHDYYIMSLGTDDNEEKREKVAQLTKIGSNYFLDISETQEEDEDYSFFDFLHPNILGHTIVKIEFQGDNINLYEFDADYIDSLIKEKRLRLKHEMVNDEIILTASTEQLRAFLTKYGNDQRLFTEPNEFYTQKVG